MQPVQRLRQMLHSIFLFLFMDNTYNMIKHCRVCGDELNDNNWLASNMKNGNYICKECRSKQKCLWYKDNHEKVRAQRSLWRKNNPEKERARSTRGHRKEGHLPMSENKDCSVYFGVYIAERVLRNSFNDVEMMPYGNKGYDFVCNQGKLIDGKSSCFNKDGRWQFHINRNPIADYFLCLAFDNRKSLNILHAWLLPGEKFNHLVSVSISPSTINKWSEYERDITKISACCDAMKN